MSDYDEIQTVQTVMILREVFAEATGNTAVRDMPLTIKMDDGESASNSFEGEGSVISIPRKFAGVDVVADGTMMLGLATHEICHIPSLDKTIELLQEAGKTQGLRTVLNYLEDVRIEAACAHETINGWLTHVRKAVKTASANEPAGLDVHSLINRLRFSEPEYPFSNIIEPIPGSKENVTDFMEVLVDRLYEAAAADSTQDVMAIAEKVLDAARLYHIDIPEDPPENEGNMGNGGGPAVSASEEASEALSDLLGDLMDGEGRGVLPGSGAESFTMRELDRQAMNQGMTFARQITRGWKPTPVTRVTIGLGRYDARMEGRAVAPFSLDLGQRKTLPRKLLLLLDVSTSMLTVNSGTQNNLSKARSAAIAVREAARSIGGQVIVYLFSNTFVKVEDANKICSIVGGGTSLTWLTGLANQHPDYDIVILTDGQVGSPRGWTPAMKARTTILAIKLNGCAPRCADIASRLQYLDAGSDIAVAVAQAANVTMVGKR